MHAPEKIELRPGQVLGGKYVLDRKIGKGGMGVVWAGTNQRTGKRVALKVLRRSFDPNSQAAELFRREASAAGRVNHPNVVTVFDIVDHEQLTCIVMELLDGEPLNEFLAREGPLSLERAAALLLPAMRGVAAANSQGVIHRDLKPHNIFLCIGPDGRLVTAKVLDFGNSLLMESEPGPAPGTDHSPIGTPAYMAPEHIAGSTPNDQRVDVYGFGVVLFEALAGQHPFPGPPGPELLSRILHEPPLSLGALRPDLPPEIIHLVDRAMAKDPKERFSNLDTLIHLLEDHLSGGSSLPRSMTPLAGVPIFPLVESHSGVADAVVQVTRRTEDSRLHDTRALYGKGEEGASGGSRASSSMKIEIADQIPNDELPSLAHSLRHLIAKPVTRGVMFAGILILVVWLAFPMSARKSSSREPQPPAPSPSTFPPVPTAKKSELVRPAPQPLPSATTPLSPASLREPLFGIPTPDALSPREPKGTSRPSERAGSRRASAGAKPPQPPQSNKAQPDGATQAAPVMQAAPAEEPSVPPDLLLPNLDSPSPSPAPPRPAPSSSPLEPPPAVPHAPGSAGAASPDDN